MGITKQVSPDGVAVGENNGHAVENEKKEARVGVLRPGQGVLEEEESRTNGITEDLRNKESKDNLPFAQQSGTQMQQHQQEQSLGPIIRWERFLPVRTLKVLLVENDDSTRQVVSALLRNCSYEVTAVANGLQAWKILEDLTNHIDLVLTEVVMPCLSGIGLLDKIMNHKSCKNIPVIMMSSNDSMGTVFKCLSKGAVDFLVKPIRKNELKNLWQHVWRRCHSSSGSGSESGIQTQKSVRSKSADDSDNNSGSNDDDDDNDDNDNESSRLNARDGSDNGSGTQSSWTKRAVEIESPQRDQLVDPPDSTCAQVIHPKPENFWTDWVSTSANGECQGQKELDDDLMGKDLEIGVPKNAEKIFDSYQAEKASKLTDTKTDELLETNGKDESVNESKNLSDEPSTQAADLIGAIGATTDIRSVSRITQAPNGFSKIQEEQEKIGNASLELPSLELSLKRLRSTADGGTVAHEDRNVLRRSDQSAFTRYHTSVASNQAPAANGGSSPFESSSEAMRTESTYNMIDNPNAAPLKQGSNSSSNANDMGSTTKNVFTNQSTYKEKASTPTIKCTQNVSAFQPVQNRAPTAQQLVQEKTEDEKTATARGQSRGQHQVQVQHHHHHYHHHHLHVHNMQQQQQQQPPPPPQLDRDGLSVKNMATDVIECGSSDVFGRQVEGNATNYSVHGSNSSSNHGSNGHNGSTTAVKVGEPNIESVNGIADQYGPVGGNGSGSGSGSGVDQHRYTQREAALKKFRQKRKERNFGKKVRYQSRKRLAEQRPRMRGQFVRQTAREEIGARKQRDDNNDDCNGHTCATEDR